MFPGLDMYYVDPGQHLTTAGEELDDLDRDLSDLSVDDLDRDLSDLSTVDDLDRVDYTQRNEMTVCATSWIIHPGKVSQGDDDREESYYRETRSIAVGITGRDGDGGVPIAIVAFSAEVPNYLKLVWGDFCSNSISGRVRVPSERHILFFSSS